MMQSDYERALEFHQESVNVALPFEPALPFLVVQSLGGLGTTFVGISETLKEKAQQYHQHALRLLENPAAMFGGTTAWTDIGFCALVSGDLDLAFNVFQKGLGHPAMFMLLERPRVLAGLAWTELASGRLSEAAGHLTEARSFAEERDMKNVLPLVAYVEAQIVEAAGEPEHALELFTSAAQSGQALSLHPLLWRAQAGAARVLESLGRDAEAQATIDEIADLFRDDQLRQMFRAGAEQQIMARQPAA